MEQLFNYIRNGGLINLINKPEYLQYREDIFKRWREMGFTLACDEKDAIILSNVFEDLLDFLSCGGVTLDTIYFYAIARRLYDNYNVILSPQQLVSSVEKYVPKMTPEEISYYHKKYNIDIEAEACVRVAKIIGKNL